jgi:LysR family transcriptional activator of nhaA
MESAKDLSEWLNYHHLRYFHAIAREGSLVKASEVLHTSQPSICAQVKQLEAALGEALYRRKGRAIALTDFGRIIYGYAEEIFSLGREMLTTARVAPSNRGLRLHLGVVDSFPKLLSLDVLRPIFSSQPPIRLMCHEGKLEDMLGQLGAHRLDALLADEVPPAGREVRTFHHPLGGSGISFCATPNLAASLSGRFPKNLHGAPLLLPTSNTALRRDLDRWFYSQKIEPRVVGEFEDAALAKVVASDGVGLTIVPSVVEAEAIERYGFVSVGKTVECLIELYLITPERRIVHPGVALLVEEAARSLQRAQEGKNKGKRPGQSRRRMLVEVSNAQTAKT